MENFIHINKNQDTFKIHTQIQGRSIKSDLNRKKKKKIK